MTRQARTATRTGQIPDMARTLNLIGDVHKGTSGGIAANRITKMWTDYSTPRHPTALYHLQLGDLTDNGTTAEDALIVAQMNLLPAPWKPVVGNHDTWSGRTGDQAAAAWGHTKNYTVDLGIAVMIAVGPDQCPVSTAAVTLSQTTLDYLDTQLTTYATRPVLICAHAPLWATATLGFGSTTTDFSINPRTTIETLLAAHAGQRIVWISAHCHTPIEDTGLVVAKTYGTARILHINASSVYYVGTTIEPTDPIRTLYLTVTAAGIEVRYRDHGSRTWCRGPSGAVVTALTWV